MSNRPSNRQGQHHGGRYPTQYNSRSPPRSPPRGPPAPNREYATQTAPGYYPYPPGPSQYPPPGPGQYPRGGNYATGPVVSQPGARAPVDSGGWMNMPKGIPNCPPGLEYLTMIDHILIHQEVDILEVLIRFETENKYIIKNSLGQKIYYAVEDSDCLSRYCLGPRRPFDMIILDNFQHEIIHLRRPYACDSCCFPCCLQSIEVSAPPGIIVGTVEQEWSIGCPRYAIKNASGDTVLRIEGPCCRMNCCGDVEFEVLSRDGSVQVGKISKQWSGLLREVYTDADNFGITFPMNLDVRMKAVMLGACFLIDMMFFETNKRRENYQRRL